MTGLSRTPVSRPRRVWSNQSSSQESISFVEGPAGDPSRLTGVQGMCAHGPTRSFWRRRVSSLPPEADSPVKLRTVPVRNTSYQPATCRAGASIRL